MHSTEKKKEKRKKEKKKKKQTYWFEPPQKRRPPQALSVSCMCMALVWMCREVHEGGIQDDGIKRVG